MTATSMKLEPPKAEEFRHVARFMRERDFKEFSAFYPTDDREKLAQLLVRKYLLNEHVICGSLDGEPICIGAVLPVWPGVGSLLFFATDSFPKIGRGITRFVKTELFPRYMNAGLHRIQAVSLDGYAEVHDWLRVIGLQQEGGPMPGYGKHGEPFVQFSMVRDVHAPGN
jgi:hypothetical protein